LTQLAQLTSPSQPVASLDCVAGSFSARREPFEHCTAACRWSNRARQSVWL